MSVDSKMETPDVVAISKHVLLNDMRPSLTVSVAAAAIMAPLLLAGYGYVLKQGFLLSMIYGIIVGMSTMGAFFFISKGKTTARKQRAANVSHMALLDREKLAGVMGKYIPIWIEFDEFDKVNWLNRQMEKLWPHLNKASCTMIKETLSPTLAAYRVGLIQGLSITKMTLGGTPPRFRGVKTYRSGKDEVTLEAEIEWMARDAPKMVLSVEIPGPNLPIKVSDIGFIGTVKIIMKPLMNEIPGFGAVLASMTEMPQLRMDIGIIGGGNITALPGIEKMIENIIKAALEDILVWPARLVVPVAAGDFSYLQLKPTGYLDITLIEGKNLPKTDMIGKTDPFVYLFVRPKKDAIKRSSVKKNNLNPVWNEGFYIEVEDLRTQSLTIRLMDDELLEKSEYVGARKLPLRDLKPRQPQDLWIDMVVDPAHPKEGKRRGRIHLNLTYVEYIDDEDRKNSPVHSHDKKKRGDGEHRGPTSHEKEGGIDMRERQGGDRALQ